MEKFQHMREGYVTLRDGTRQWFSVEANSDEEMKNALRQQFRGRLIINIEHLYTNETGQDV